MKQLNTKPLTHSTKAKHSSVRASRHGKWTSCEHMYCLAIHSDVSRKFGIPQALCGCWTNVPGWVLVSEVKPNSHHKWLGSHRQTVWSPEEPETLPVGIKSRTWHCWSPGGEKCRKRQCPIVYLLDQRWNHFKGDTGQTSEKWGETYGLSWAHRYHLELNWAEVNKAKSTISAVTLRRDVQNPRYYLWV